MVNCPLSGHKNLQMVQKKCLSLFFLVVQASVKYEDSWRSYYLKFRTTSSSSTQTHQNSKHKLPLPAYTSLCLFLYGTSTYVIFKSGRPFQRQSPGCQASPYRTKRKLKKRKCGRFGNNGVPFLWYVVHLRNIANDHAFVHAG